MGGTGINGVVVLSSTDGVSFSPIPGGPTQFARQLANGPLPPEVFSFGAVSATHIRFEISSNWGDPSQTGFAEVHFREVPAPGVAVLAAAGAVAASRRRRR